MPYSNHKDSGSSTRAATSSYSSSSSSYDPLREYRLSESTSRSDASERFFVTGQSSRSGDSMARQMKQWDNDWSKVSRQR